jgi:23S rRNA (adenine1618-N6)-methyltransferase
MHPRNLHKGRYDFNLLCQALPELSAFLKQNPKGEKTIDFSDQKAVIALNQALLKVYYNVEHWLVPEGYLCPPIPGRADYIHHLADLLKCFKNFAEKNARVKVLDIGTGANLIYPILGSQIYGWSFIGSDIDKTALKSARLIREANKNLSPLIKVVEQKQPEHIFTGLIRPGDHYTLTMCNPPFHASQQEADEGSARKWQNLNKQSQQKTASHKSPVRNFGGQNNELWCKGGEIAFLRKMARESRDFSEQVEWFTSLVSKKENIRPMKMALKKQGAKTIEVVKMAQGQKISRFIAWQF